MTTGISKLQFELLPSHHKINLERHYARLNNWSIYRSNVGDRKTKNPHPIRERNKGRVVQDVPTNIDVHNTPDDFYLKLHELEQRDIQNRKSVLIQKFNMKDVSSKPENISPKKPEEQKGENKGDVEHTLRSLLLNSLDGNSDAMGQLFAEFLKGRELIVSVKLV